MRKLNTKDYARALYQTTKDLPAIHLPSVSQNFVALLARRHLLKKSDRLIADFVSYAKRQEGITEITITAAREMPETTVNKIKKTFAEKVEAIEQVDPSLIGGFIVRTPDKIFDASLKTQLQRLRHQLSFRTQS